MYNLVALQHRRGQRLFTQFLPHELVSQSEDIVHRLIDRLFALGPTPTQEQVQTEITDCVQQFNDLDASVANSWIFTIEREDIGEVIWSLIDLCGFEGSEEWLSGRELVSSQRLTRR